MTAVGESVIAIVVKEREKAPAFLKTFSDLLEKTDINNKTRLKLEIFESLSAFLKAQKTRNNLNGIIVDLKLLAELSELERKAFEMLEDLQIPTLKISEAMVFGDAVEKKILTGKWTQLMDQVEVFAPRGLRVHQRKICFVKIRYRDPKSQQKDSSTTIKAVTFDISLGGCFIVSMDDWSGIDQIDLYVDELKDPVPCRIAWKLPWGASPWKMPGIGVEFVEMSEDLRKTLKSYLQKS